MANRGPGTARPIEFIDLGAQRRRLGARLDAAILRVVDQGKYIMGPDVAELERRLADYCGVKHALGVSSGTDALVLGLMAKSVGQGDAVFVPSFTFAATAEAVAWLGATPVFVDVRDDTFNIDLSSLESGLGTARKLGLRPAAVIAVDLFGQPADYDELEAFARREGLWLMADAAQSFGASYRGRKVGQIGDISATSFYPAKPLGCYGDGGAVFTNDDGLAAAMRSLRIHGQGSDKYDNVRIGINGRLDTIQAAILIEKLSIFPDEIVARQRAADRYAEALADVAVVPRIEPECTSVWAQYTVRLPGRDRNAIAARLAAAGVPTATHYPKPVHQQTAYRCFPVAGNGLPVSERVAGEVLSLPMHPYLDEESQDRVIAELRAALA